MSKVVLVCSRKPGETLRIEAVLSRLGSDIVPDHISPAPTEILVDGIVRVALINPSLANVRHGASVLLGHTVGECADWWKPGAVQPDGAYGIFRVHGGKVELVADRLASRTIWYVLTDTIFVASTSQRAIAMLLGSFEPNEDAALWMLSSGSLGPGNAWDKRVRRLEPDTSACFDSKLWSIKTDVKSFEFNIVRQSRAKHRAKLAAAIDHVFSNIDLDYSKIVLPLSGGFDSRGLLIMLKDKGLAQCVTWGLASSLKDKRNDAYIAGQVAEYFGVEHRYLYTDAEASAHTTETIMNRILVAGEGRTARISGYTDGLAIWKLLHDSNIHGIVRGDMAFGVDPAWTEFEARRLGRLTLMSDFQNLPDARALDLPAQALGEEYSRRPGESLPAWRDRCYQTYAVPAQLAALTDFKSSYVEVVNPLLSNSIVDCIRMQPDPIRTNKRLWQEIIRERGPKIPFAETSAPATVSHFLKKASVVEILLTELDSSNLPNVLTPKLVQLIRGGIEISDGLMVKRSRLRRAIRPFVPERLRELTGQLKNKNILDINILGFRAFLVCRMSRILQRDAESSR